MRTTASCDRDILFAGSVQSQAGKFAARCDRHVGLVGARPTRQTSRTTACAIQSVFLCRCAMSLYGFKVGPTWPAKRSEYDYLLTLPRPGWAWECLRRSDAYCLAARVHGCVKAWALPGSPLVQLSRTRRRSLDAESWGLHCFRRS